MYYDPLLDIHHKVPISPVVGKVTYLLPLVPEDARRLFDGAIEGMGGLRDEIPEATLANPRDAGTLLHAAKEWDLNDLAERLQAACDDALEPTWDRGRGEFTWGCGLDEEHPRGQYNSLLALAEANSEGAWTRLATQLLPENEPRVEGVDFPAVALSEARWVGGELHLRLSPQNDSFVGLGTKFRIVGLEEPGAWQVLGPGAVEVDGPNLVVSAEIGDHSLVIRRSVA